MTCSKRGLRTSGLVFVALLVLLSGCRPGPGPGSEVPAGMPVVLISIDTLRADRLPVYGYGGVETPAIDALRRDSILFERAYSHIPLTLPAHASLLTGLLPPEHGVRDNVGYPFDTAQKPFLPRALKELGYQTGGAVSAYVLRGATGMSESFDFYEDSIEFRNRSGLGGLQRRGMETLELALPWLRSVAEEPFFFFLHLYDPHTPYQAPEPFASRYSDPYDAEIAASDQVVGALVDELRRLGVYDRALILLLSDHGEAFGEHGEVEHGVLLYTTTLQVPLLLKLPGGERGGDAVSYPVQLADVLPTLRDLLRLELDGDVPGRNLLERGASEEHRIYAETFYPRLHLGWSELTSLISGPYQYIEGPDPELYDLLADPAQEKNLLREKGGVTLELRDALATYDRALTAPAEADEETREALAALGYLGSSAGLTQGPLPDPKARIHTLADLKTGFDQYAREDFAAAVVSFRRALAENPQMLDAWEYLARSLHGLDRLEEALEAFTEAMRRSGGASAPLALSAAALLLDLERFDEARDHARLALVGEPAMAHALLAQVELAAKRLDEAESHARQALEMNRESRQGGRQEAKESRLLGPRITLGEVLHARGEFEEALELTREILGDFDQRQSRDPSLIQGLYTLRGKAYADLGQPAEAERAFLRELELHPEAISTYTHLALLYALSDRPELVGETLRRMVESNPSARAYAEAVKTLRLLGDERSARGLLRRATELFPEAELLRAL